jgi:hypothetical protein
MNTICLKTSGEVPGQGGVDMKSFRYAGLVSILLIILVVGLGSAAPGSVFTTNSTCTATNVNDYTSKLDVYIRGNNFPDGYYYVQVTTPGGTLLGTSVGSACWTPVHVSGGSFGCYQLWAIVNKESDDTQGFDTTPNADDNYKVWVSSSSTFPGSDSKVKVFNVTAALESSTLNVLKFYDANANGIDDDSQYMTGWLINISNATTGFNRSTNVTEILEPGTYTVREYMPVENSWRNTTPLSFIILLSPGEEETVKFGNLCLGEGGGHTIGFWRNPNGKLLIGADDLALLNGLNLTNATGAVFDPADIAALDNWLHYADSVNMAYMLSAQLAAMELNVYNGLVDGNSIIYAPNTTSANALGYATVTDIMAEANAELGLHPLTTTESPYREYQEDLKDALDDANNNLNFVQPTPCIFTFA